MAEVLMHESDVPPDLAEFFVPVADSIDDVFKITPKPFRDAHFATFPPALVERCVKAGTSERGCCPQCGTAWERVTERKTLGIAYTDHTEDLTKGMSAYAPQSRKMDGRTLAKFRADNPPHDLGFRPACTCPAADPVPCVVLDPFVGSGTTAAVAKSLGRDCIGIDLNPRYLTMARARLAVEESKTPLFA